MREVGAKENVANALTTLGTIALEQGAYARAVARAEESLALFQEMGAPRGCALALTLLGDAARDRGDHERALARYAEGLALLRHGRAAGEVVDRLEGLAGVAAARGQPGQAACLLGAAARLAIGTPPPVDVVSYIRTLAAARRALGLGAAPGEQAPRAEASVPVWVEGQVLLLEQAIAAAVGGAASC
jgi:tetratricopeptide (TPR) repeat protein